jgi:DNA-binding protein H-NS
MIIEDLKKMSMDALQDVITNAQDLMEKFEKDKKKEAIKKIQEIAAEVNLDVVIRESGKTIKAGSKGIPKYRNPDNPKQTWTGKGKRPKWFLDAIASGMTPEDLEI